MNREVINKIDDLQVELEGVVNNFILAQMFISDQIESKTISEGLFGICRHFERLNEELSKLVSEGYKIK